ncbi:hypothetical protein KBI51_08040 [Aerococcaceae bacterium zg-ZUI334]|uniref:hypothetical protein n=1 Tax=Aerococcaceae bacterium zg-252 TaxID=2796928 RepID=UPI001B8E41B0|nr:hypothetical protein [Aerococcaceae bacterium zg-ZUI334]
MREFTLIELLLYIVPCIAIYGVQRYLKPHLKYFKQWPITMAMLLIPLWLTLIYLFGWLIFDYNLIPFVLFFSCFVLGLQLYDYVKRISVFTYRQYYLPATKLLFQHLSSFLIGLVLLRIMTYFLG